MRSSSWRQNKEKLVFVRVRRPALCARRGLNGKVFDKVLNEWQGAILLGCSSICRRLCFNGKNINVLLVL